MDVVQLWRNAGLASLPSEGLRTPRRVAILYENGIFACRQCHQLMKANAGVRSRLIEAPTEQACSLPDSSALVLNTFEIRFMRNIHWSVTNRAFLFTALRSPLG